MSISFIKIGAKRFQVVAGEETYGTVSPPPLGLPGFAWRYRSDKSKGNQFYDSIFDSLEAVANNILKLKSEGAI